MSDGQHTHEAYEAEIAKLHKAVDAIELGHAERLASLERQADQHEKRIAALEAAPPVDPGEPEPAPPIDLSGLPDTLKPGERHVIPTTLPFDRMFVHWWLPGDDWGDDPLHDRTSVADSEGDLTITVPSGLPEQVRLQVQQADGSHKADRSPLNIEQPVVVPPPGNPDRPKPPPITEAKVITLRPGLVASPEMPNDKLVYIDGPESTLLSPPVPRKGQTLVISVRAIFGTFNSTENFDGEVWIIGGTMDGEGAEVFAWGGSTGRFVLLGVGGLNYRRFYYGNKPLTFEHYDGSLYEIGEDCYHGGKAIIKNVTLRKVCHRIGHPDVFQPTGPGWLVDGVNMPGAWGMPGSQLIAANNTTSRGGTFKNINASSFAGIDGNGNHVGNGVYAGAENMHFENIIAPNMTFNTSGGSGVVKACEFRNRQGDWTY